MERGLARAGAVLRREPAGTVDRGRDSSERNGDSGSGGEQGRENGRTFIIQKLVLQADMKNLRDLRQLQALLAELEDIANSSAVEDPGADPDAVPVPV